MQEVQAVKRVIVTMDMASGFIPIKQLMKVNGLEQKNMVKEHLLGLTENKNQVFGKTASYKNNVKRKLY